MPVLPTLRIMASRHSAFYSPLLSSIRLLRQENCEVEYRVLGPGQRSYILLRDREVDVMQSAVSSNWKPLERGLDPLPVHFAQINRRDGFFLAARLPDPEFHWKKLEGQTVLADHGLQPLLMLKYAVRHNGAAWDKIRVIDAGTPEQMQDSFRAGTGDYVHLQAPILAGEVVASVGAAMPEVAFSSLCCTREFQKTSGYFHFLNLYQQARIWVRTAPAEEVADAEAGFFPQIPREALVDAIRRYQELGCWNGDIEIPRDLYEQALDVFESAGEIARRHPYQEVVG